LQEALYDKRKSIFKQTSIAIFLVIISFSIFIPSLYNDFVWDDHEQIYNFKAYDPDFRLGFIFEEHLFDVHKVKGYHFRPIYYNSIIADYKIWKLSPFGYHLTSIILNCLVTVLLYFFALTLLKHYRIARAGPIALFASLLFAVYPLHVENVAFIGARADLLSTLFLLFAFLYHIKSVGKWYLVLLSGLFYLLSLLSKELGACFLIIVLGLDILNRGLFVRINIFRYSIYLFVTIFYYLLRGRDALGIVNFIAKWFKDGKIEDKKDTIVGGNAIVADIDVSNFPYFENIRSFFDLYYYYVGKFFYPFDLNPLFVVNIDDTIYFIISLVVIGLIVLISLFILYKKNTIVPFLILWIFAGLGPGLLVGILNIGLTNVAERFTYFSTCAFCILLAYLIIVFSDRLNMKKLGIALSLILVLSYTITTIRGQEKWINNYTFWKTTIEKNPMSPIGYIGYGTSLRNSGKPYEAIKNYLYALGDNFNHIPRKSKAMLSENLAIAYLDTGDFETSEKWFIRARDYYGNRRAGRKYHFHMGLLYFQKGEQNLKKGFYEMYNYKRSERHLKQNLLGKRKANAIDYLVLAEVKFRLGEKQEAAKYAQLAMQSKIKAEHYIRAEEILNKSLSE